MDKRRSLHIGRSTIQGTLDEIMQVLMKGRPDRARAGVFNWLQMHLTTQSRQNFITRNRK